MSGAGVASSSRPTLAEARLRRWFASRGWKPFEFQRETWHAYLAGESGLVHAPTGMGKSYAVWGGPVIEWMGERTSQRGRAASKHTKPEPLRVLWLTPLRALAHDTHQTLSAMVEGLELPWSVELRTGDTSSAQRARQRLRLPTALVTTPESLSVLLSYSDARERLSGVRCVVVDEWHELMGTKRGVQTELGLARLRQWNPGLRTWGMSATMGNLDEARDVLMGGAPTTPPPRLITAPDQKRTEMVTLIPPDMERFPWSGHLGLKLLPEVLESIGQAASTLLFTNTRSQAEAWFRAIVHAKPEWLGEVALHHGSLDRGLRERVEAMLREGRLRCVVCTSSMELGVDFSPVDQVFQVGSPKGVGRVMQRAGRSGHRPGAISRIVGVPAHAFELVEFAGVREALTARRIESRRPVTMALDVLVQHLVTAAAGGGFYEAQLFDEVRTTHAFAALTRQQWRWCLDFVTHGGPTLRIYPQYGRVVRDAAGLHTIANRRIERTHRLMIGTITSNVTIKVRTIGGSVLGTIEESFISRLSPGDRFVFAGRTLELVRVREMTAFVRRVTGRQGIVPRWDGGRFPLSTQLAEAVRAKLDEARRGAAAEPEMRTVMPILNLQQRWSRLPGPGELLIERTRTRDGYHVLAYPFEGRSVHEGLGALLAYRLARHEPRTLVVTANDYGLELLSPTELAIDAAQWRALLSGEGLVEDLLQCLNATQMARRQFRDIARIAGLIFPGFPGAGQTARHLQASSELFFEVFEEFDRENLLLDQARREVLNQQLEVRRLAETLRRVSELEIMIVETARLSPLAFPLWADRLRSQHLSTEKWSERVQRMVVQLESAADRESERDAKRERKAAVKTKADQRRRGVADDTVRG